MSDWVFMISLVASVLLELEISLLRKTTAEILKQKPYLISVYWHWLKVYNAVYSIQSCN